MKKILLSEVEGEAFADFLLQEGWAKDIRKKELHIYKRDGIEILFCLFPLRRSSEVLEVSCAIEEMLVGLFDKFKIKGDK